MIEFAPNSENEMTYDEAILYCQFLEYNGHRDWRMPTHDEYRVDARMIGWYLDDAVSKTGYAYHVTPVRCR